MDDQTGTVEGKGLVELLARATVDPTFRSQLLANPDTYAAQYQLSENDTAALKTVDESKFEEAATAMSTSADFVIGIGMTGHFYASQPGS